MTSTSAPMSVSSSSTSTTSRGARRSTLQCSAVRRRVLTHLRHDAAAPDLMLGLWGEGVRRWRLRRRRRDRVHSRKPIEVDALCAAWRARGSDRAEPGDAGLRLHVRGPRSGWTAPARVRPARRDGPPVRLPDDVGHLVATARILIGSTGSSCPREDTTAARRARAFTTLRTARSTGSARRTTG